MTFKIPADVTVPAAAAILASGLALAIGVSVGAIAAGRAEINRNLPAGHDTARQMQEQARSINQSLPAMASRACFLALDANGNPQELGQPRWR